MTNQLIQADPLLTIKQAAEYVQASPNTIYGMIAEERLKAKRLTNKKNSPFRIRKSELDRLFATSPRK